MVIFVTAFDETTAGYLRVIDVRTREVLAEARPFAPDVAFTEDGSLLVLTDYLEFGKISITNSLKMERKISPQNVRSTNYKSVGNEFTA